MNLINVIEQVYLAAEQPVPHVHSLATELRHWYQAFPATNYLQPCVIGGKAALVCQRHLSHKAPQAFRALQAICLQYGIYLKEDARRRAEPANIAHNHRKLTIVLTFCLTMANSQAASLNQAAVPAVNQARSQTISLLIDQERLSDVTLKIAEQTGICFKFNAAVENDLISKKLQAQDWKSALAQLLQGYNYSTIQEGDAVRTVFITGYRGGIKPEAAGEPSAGPYAGRSEDFLGNKVAVDVTIPTEELAGLPEDGRMQVDLPVGSFAVRQESMVALEDGTLSWVGTMDDENQFYRLYLARTQDGEVVGNVFTPDGAYNIETIDGQTVMVEVQQVSMR